MIGSAHSITALRRNQVDAYWRRHYRPTEIVVAAAGAVDHDRLVDQLGSFAAFAGDRGRGSRRVPRPSAATEVRGGSQIVAGIRDSAQVSAILAAGCPGMFDDRRYALGLLSLVLGGGMSSRLFVEVRERRRRADADGREAERVGDRARERRPARGAGILEEQHLAGRDPDVRVEVAVAVEIGERRNSA